MNLAVFIDYDNLLDNHKVSGILDVTTSALLRTPLMGSDVRGTCDVRIYGGWYEGPMMTQMAQRLSAAIQRDFPTIIRLPNPAPHYLSLRTTAELAMAMLEEPGHHLFDTYRKKTKPGNLRVQKPEAIGCTDALCPLPMAKKLLKTGNCPNSTCVITATDLVYRHEQKIVDTMLTCDMIHAPALNYDQIVLVSGDDDFLPPLRTVLLRGNTVTRFHPRPNRFRGTPLDFRNLLEMDL